MKGGNVVACVKVDSGCDAGKDWLETEAVLEMFEEFLPREIEFFQKLVGGDMVNKVWLLH